MTERPPTLSDHIAAAERGDPPPTRARTHAERIAAVHRGGPAITEQQRAAATALLTDMVAAAERHGVTLDDLDATVDLPGGCLDVIRSKSY